MGRLEGPVLWCWGCPALSPGQSALPGDLQAAGPGWAECPSGGRKAWPCLAEGTAHRRLPAEPTSSPRSEGQDHRVQEPQGTDLPSLDLPL